MWKIVRAEISYLKPWIYGVSMIFISLAVYYQYAALRDFMEYKFIPVDIVILLLPIITIVFFGLNIFLLYSESKEMRVRMLSALPLARRNLASSRHIPPLLLLVICVFLGFLTWWIIFIPFPLFWILHELEEMTNWTVGSFIQDALTVVIMTAVLTLILRLLTEWQGRIILMILAGVLAVNSIVLRNLMPRIYIKVGDFLKTAFESSTHGITVGILMFLLLAALLHYFFMTRKSYLA